MVAYLLSFQQHHFRRTISFRFQSLKTTVPESFDSGTVVFRLWQSKTLSYYFRRNIRCVSFTGDMVRPSISSFGVAFNWK